MKKCRQIRHLLLLFACYAYTKNCLRLRRKIKGDENVYLKNIGKIQTFSVFAIHIIERATVKHERISFYSLSSILVLT